MARTKGARVSKRQMSTVPPDTFLEDTAAVTFSGRQIDITKIDRAWEQQRGAMARIALLVLRDDDSQLAENFCKSDKAAMTGMEMADQLHAEAEFLKNGIEILEAAISRLMTVAARRQMANDRAKEARHGH